MVGITTEPAHHRPAVKLFAPQQSTGGRAKDQGVISAEARGTGVEIIETFLFALLQQLIKGSIERISLQLAGQPQINHPLPAAGDAMLQQQPGFGAFLRRIHRLLLAIHHITVKGIFHIGLRVGLLIEPLGVGGVFGEQPGALLPAGQLVAAKAVNIRGFDAIAIAANR